MNEREKCTEHFRIYFCAICWTLRGLSKKAMFDFTAFIVLKKMYNVIFMQKFFWQITAYIAKFGKRVEDNITFIFDALSEIVTGFV